jgi:hypothetical protein
VTVWAGELGNTVDPAAISQTLTAKNAFVEETLLSLLTTLGIAGG